MEELLKQVGAQSAVAAVLLGTAIYTARWFAQNIAKPLTERHMKFTDEVENNTRQQTKILESLNVCILEMKETQKEHLMICREGHGPSKTPWQAVKG